MINWQRFFLIMGCMVLSSLVMAQRYKKIHHRAVLIDTHNDVLTTVTLEGMRMEDDLSGKAHTDIRRFKKGGVDVQVFSVFCDERYGSGTAFKHALREIDSLEAIVTRNRADMMMVHSSNDLQEALKSRKIGCMIGVEGGHMIEDRLDYLDSLYRRGTRYMTITWNNSTSWASSAKDETEGLPAGRQKGLTVFGKQVIRRMNELGMLVDLSHVGEQTFWDALAVSTKPVLVSHSSAWALCPHRRNLKDEQIRAIKKNGGVIHINFYSGFIDSTYETRKKAFQLKYQKQADSLRALQWAGYQVDEWMARQYPSEAATLRPPLSLLIDHIDHMVKLAGANHVGLGSDFDGIESAPQQMDDVAAFPLVTRELLKRGYNRKDIKKILGGNFRRLLRANGI
jgi:membrane dipeptidase